MQTKGILSQPPTLLKKGCTSKFKIGIFLFKLFFKVFNTSKGISQIHPPQLNGI